MNLLQMICCAFVMKGSELGQQYLGRQTAQDLTTRRRLDRWIGTGTLRRQLGQTASSVNDLLNAAIKETEATGVSLCNCEEITLPAEGTTKGTTASTSGEVAGGR